MFQDLPSDPVCRSQWWVGHLSLKKITCQAGKGHWDGAPGLRCSFLLPQKKVTKRLRCCFAENTRYVFSIASHEKRTSILCSPRRCWHRLLSIRSSNRTANATWPSVRQRMATTGNVWPQVQAQKDRRIPGLNF